MNRIDNMIKEMKDWSETESGKEHLKKIVEDLICKQNRRNRNVEKIKKMFTDQKSFNKLVKKIIAKYYNILQPLELIYALFDLSEKEGKKCAAIDDFTNNFPSSIYTYKGWKFAVTYGQGSICSIYYKKKLMYRD